MCFFCLSHFLADEMIQQPQQAGPYLLQQNVPLMVEVRPERQIENTNSMTDEEIRLYYLIWCRYAAEMVYYYYSDVLFRYY